MRKYLSPEECQQLAEEAVKAERAGRLSEVQLDVLFRRRMFHMFVPKELGGLGLELPEALRLQEELAYVDGSVGWTATLCSGASWFVGFLDPDVRASLFADRLSCFGGSGMITGIADRQLDGAFRVNGSWKYATGAPHLTVFTANCQLSEGGQMLMDANGEPVVRPLWFYRSEVECLEDWKAMGLKATASHSFRVRDVLIGPDRFFQVLPTEARLPDPVYRFPFVQFAELTLAANYFGMFRRFFECCDERGIARPEVDVFRDRRTRLFDIADGVWEVFLTDPRPMPASEQLISQQCRQAIQEGLRLVSSCFPKTGMEGANETSTLNRLWRDIFTASQHAIFRS